jgi:hypothetical protein
MATYNTKWEDDDHNRIVELVVDYQLDDDQVTLVRVTPTSVLFFDKVTQQPCRRIGVWTDRGRQLLAKAFCANGREAQLIQEMTDSLPTAELLA